MLFQNLVIKFNIKIKMKLLNIILLYFNKYFSLIKIKIKLIKFLIFIFSISCFVLYKRSNISFN